MATASLSPLTFNEALHAYTLNGQPVPSVTQVLRHTRYVKLVEDILEKAEGGEITWFEAITLMQQRMRTLEAARDRGQRVHAALHYLHDDDLDWDTLDDEARGYLDSARLYLDAHVQTVYRAEFRVWSVTHGYAGTLDWFGLHRDGYLSIDDAKTGDPSDVAADLQLSAYLGAVLEMRASDPELDAIIRGAKAPVIHRRSIRLFRDGRMAKETLYRDPQDYARFLRALGIVHDQRKRPVPLVAWDDER